MKWAKKWSVFFVQCACPTRMVVALQGSEEEKMGIL